MPLRTLLSLIVCFALLLLLSPQVRAAMHPGFRTLGIWNEEQKLRMDLCIWYPVNSSPSTVRYGDWVLSVNRRASPINGRFPLLVISHDSAGSRFAHHELAATLSTLGFIVVAPTHPHDNAQDMSTLFTPSQMIARLDELTHTISAVCADLDLKKVVDTNRIGVIGFGSGAATALLAAGGTFSPSAWESWKVQAPSTAPYMYRWTRTRIDSMVADPVLAVPHPDRRIRAIALVAPAFSMVFDAPSLTNVRIPVLLAAAGRDPVNPAPVYLNRLRDALPVAPQTIFIPEATPLALMSRPDGRTEHLPSRIPLSDRLRAQTLLLLEQGLSLFFQNTIGDPNLPPPPPEPEQQPEPVKESVSPPPAATTPAPARRQQQKRRSDASKTPRPALVQPAPAVR